MPTLNDLSTMSVQNPKPRRWQFSLGDLLLGTGLIGLMIFPFAYEGTRWMWLIVIASDVLIVFMVLAARYSEDQFEHNETRELREESTE